MLKLTASFYLHASRPSLLNSAATTPVSSLGKSRLSTLRCATSASVICAPVYAARSPSFTRHNGHRSRFWRDFMNCIQNHREGGIADVYDRHRYCRGNIRIMEAVAAKILALAEGTDAPTNVVSLRS